MHWLVLYCWEVSQQVLQDVTFRLWWSYLFFTALACSCCFFLVIRVEFAEVSTLVSSSLYACGRSPRTLTSWATPLKPRSGSRILMSRNSLVLISLRRI